MKGPGKVITFAFVGSALAHTLMVAGLKPPSELGKAKEKKSIQVKVVEKEEKKPEPISKLEPPPPPPPKPKKPPPPKPKPPQTVREAKPKTDQPAKKVLGLSKQSFQGQGKMAAPAGNTSMAKDEGIRLKPEEVAALGKSLAQDAKLIPSSVPKVEKTDSALDAGLVGRYVVDVFVDASGQVTSAELRRSIGYGMDALVLSAAKKARFKPRRNAKGVPMSGWTKIIFRFTEFDP